MCVANIKSVTFFITTITIVSIFADKELPSYIPKCHLHVPIDIKNENNFSYYFGNTNSSMVNTRLSKCVVDVLHKLRHRVAKYGIPELGVPHIDPLVVPMIKLEQGTKMINYKAMLKDVFVHGFGNYNITDLKINVQQLNFNSKIYFGNISLTSDYIIMGKIKMVPIHGTGILSANLTDAKGDIATKGRLMKKHGDIYFHNMDTKFNLQVGSAVVHFSNLYDGDEQLTKLTNTFLKLHASELINEIKPAIETVLGMLVDDIANRVYGNVPLKKLFTTD